MHHSGEYLFIKYEIVCIFIDFKIAITTKVEHCKTAI